MFDTSLQFYMHNIPFKCTITPLKLSYDRGHMVFFPIFSMDNISHMEANKVKVRKFMHKKEIHWKWINIQEKQHCHIIGTDPVYVR